MSQALIDQSLDGEQQTVAPGTKAPFISVVMPCLNEERTVAQCVATAFEALRASGLDGEVVVADNGSTDASRLMAERAGARVVNCAQPGYGHAIRCGVRHARGDVVLMGDADGSYDFGELPAFVQAIQAGADLVMGNRFLGGIRPGAMPWKNRYFGTPLLTRLVNFLFGSRVGDVQCGLRAFTRDAYKRMRLKSGGMELASEMVVKSARAGLQVVEVPTALYPDGRGRRPHLRPWRDGLRNLKLLLLLCPTALFLVPGMVMFALGMLLVLLPVGGQVRFAGLRLDIHWMVLGVLMAVVGLQVVCFGLAARLFAVTHRFPESDPLLDWLRARGRLEHGLLAGTALIVVGTGIDGWILWDWIHGHFGPLERVRPALLATTLIAVGVQTIFCSCLVTIMSERSCSEHRARDTCAEQQSK